MSTCTILSRELDNGLNLLCLDQSKKIAVDRWYVCVWVQITIPVDEKWFVMHPLDTQTFQQIRKALGQEVIFKQKKERNFVSDDQKMQIINQICDRAVEMGSKYLGRDDFAAKYILKVFSDYQKHRQPRQDG